MAMMVPEAVFPMNPTQDDYEFAKEKARELLQRVLPNLVWKEYRETGLVKIIGKRGTYFISPFSHTEIRDLEHNKLIAHACLQFLIPAPIYDRVIAEYLLIKNDEDRYWVTANIFFVSKKEFSVKILLFMALDAFLFANLLWNLLLI
jgi:hypothetical protein